MLLMLKSLWQYRNFVASSIKSELVSRFAQSKLGALWVVIHPLTQAAIYAVIFSKVLGLRADLPGMDGQSSYAAYLLAGLLCWTLFAEVVGRGVNVFVEQSNYIKKMKFPIITLPVITVGSCLLNNLMLLLSVCVIFLLLEHNFGLIMLQLLPLIGVTVMLGLGLSLFLAVFNVFMRDISHITQIVLQVWFWLTPIVYTVRIIPEHYHYLLYLNPMYILVEAYHSVLIYGVVPQWGHVALVFSFGIALTLIALFLFRKARPEMVDVL